MNRVASPAVDARMGTRLPELGLRLLLALVAAGLTAALWLGAAAESSRHQVPAKPRVPAHITLPTVVVTAHRERAKELRSQIVAGTSLDCANAPADQPPRRLSR
jgi:hypothetical protein